MPDETQSSPDETPTEPLNLTDIEAERQRQLGLTPSEEDGTRQIGQDLPTSVDVPTLSARFRGSCSP
jgi:hypothetical protein